MPAKAAVTEKRWVVDTPAKAAVTEQKWIIDQPAKAAWTEQGEEQWELREWYQAERIQDGTLSPKFPKTPEGGTALDEWMNQDIGYTHRWWNDAEWISLGRETIHHPAVPEKGHWETVVVTPAVAEQGHWETVVITPAVPEKGHWE